VTTNAEAKAMADGQRARAAMEYMEPIFARLRESATSKLFASAVGDAALREDLYRTVATINALEAEICRAIKAGEMAAIVKDHFERVTPK